LVVAPSPEFDDRVAREARDGAEILRSADRGKLLFNPYAVSAIYYRESFLGDFPDTQSDAHPSRRIIAQLSRIMTPAIRSRFAAALCQMYAGDVAEFPDRFVRPVDGAPSSRRRRRTHQNALDIFADEGSAVRSATRGVVVLADRGWNESDPFSTSSPQGGNSVIVLDPLAAKFYRYCHLDDVQVVAGAIVGPGEALGTVGHSGWNASRPGHGRHLHLEVHSIRDGSIHPASQAELLKLLGGSEPARERTEPCGTDRSVVEEEDNYGQLRVAESAACAICITMPVNCCG
jgi:murein DD-endopeptidase MepM/ murein hydrolase activator NlpD